MTIAGPPPEDLEALAFGDTDWGYEGTVVAIPGLRNAILTIREAYQDEADGLIYRAVRTDFEDGMVAGDALFAGDNFPRPLKAWAGEAGVDASGNLYGTAHVMSFTDVNSPGNLEIRTIQVDCATLACSVANTVPVNISSDPDSGWYWFVSQNGMFVIPTAGPLVMVIRRNGVEAPYGYLLTIDPATGTVLGSHEITEAFGAPFGMYWNDGVYSAELGETLIIGNSSQRVGGYDEVTSAACSLTFDEDGVANGLTQVHLWPVNKAYARDEPYLRHVVPTPAGWRVVRIETSHTLYLHGQPQGEDQGYVAREEGYVEVWDVDATGAELAAHIKNVPPRSDQHDYAGLVRYGYEEQDVAWRSDESGAGSTRDSTLIQIYKYQDQYDFDTEFFAEQFGVEVIEVPYGPAPEPTIFDLFLTVDNPSQYPSVYRLQPVVTDDGTRFALGSMTNGGGVEA